MESRNTEHWTWNMELENQGIDNIEQWANRKKLEQDKNHRF
jgi:hypothetical protein